MVRPKAAANPGGTPGLTFSHVATAAPSGDRPSLLLDARGLMRGMRTMFAVMACVLATAASAGEISTIGRASVPVSNDAAAVRAAATAQARKAAVTAAVEKVLGPGASRDPRVAGKLDAVVAQVADESYVDTKASTAAGQYSLAVTLVVDDKAFRTLLSDLGIATGTATARGASILAIMDEFVTTARDLNAPLEELTAYRRDSGTTFRDKSKGSASQSSKSTSHDAHSAHVDGWDGAGSDHHQSYDASSDSSNVNVKHDVASAEHDNESYVRLVKYQPKNTGPEKTSQTWNAIAGQLQDYDLRLLDNDVFRSKYFRNHPMTLDQLTNGASLQSYVRSAKSDMKADFFLVGTSVIIDAGKNGSTGDQECTGVVSVKTYSTVDGESIASETISDVTSGRNLDDCAANLSRKLARIAGPIVGARVQEYWKRRDTYGREVVLTLKGLNLPLKTKAAFVKAVKGTPGIEGDTQRVSDANLLQLVVSYKGADPLDQALALQLAELKDFDALDSRTEGNQVILCLGPCAKVEKKLGNKL